MEDIPKIMSLLPKEASSQVAKTACETFEKLISPLTEITSGVARLIHLKFDQLCDERKIIAAKCLQEAEEKIRGKKINKRTVIKPAVFYEALESTDQQTDETLRSLWANLLAKEIIEGSIHPEIARLLSKITSKDALLLLEISETESIPIVVKVLKALASQWTLGILNKRKTFHHVYLENLGLIQEIESAWYLTTIGREFMRCVSDPK